MSHIIKNDIWTEIEDIVSDLKNDISSSDQYALFSLYLSNDDYPLTTLGGSVDKNISNLYLDDYNDINLYGDKLFSIRSLGKNFISLENSIRAKEGENLLAIYDDICSIIEELEIQIDIDFYSDNLYPLVETVESKSIDLLYTIPKPIIKIDSIIESSSNLIKRIYENNNLLYNISPRDFERVISELFLHQGFKVELTKQTRDGGYDIIAFSNVLDIQSKYIIECKRYTSKKVSIDVVRRLLGVKLTTSANKAILVTSSFYTPDATSLAKNHIWELSLKDKNDILLWIKQYCIKNYKN